MARHRHSDLQDNENISDELDRVVGDDQGDAERYGGIEPVGTFGGEDEPPRIMLGVLLLIAALIAAANYTR